MTMDVQGILAIVFVAIFCAFVFWKRKSIVVQKIAWPILYFVMYRTKKGLSMMDRLAARFPFFWRVFSFVGIIVGFLGMALISFELIAGTLKLFAPGGAPGIMPVLPFEAKGVFFVPFSYWIISIFIIAFVHEFAHGIVARYHNIKLLSAGFAFFSIFIPLIPAAFVEPDEKALAKKSRVAQLGVFAAGPFSNIVFALIVILITSFIISPISAKVLVPDGVLITDVSVNSSAEKAGIHAGEVITQLDDVKVTSAVNFTSFIANTKPEQNILLKTNESSYSVFLGATADGSKGFLGVKGKQSYIFTSVLSSFMLSLYNLMYWLFVLSLGIGLFNLLPIGIVDGGRMFKMFTDKVFRKHSHKVWACTSFLFLAIIVFNLIAGFLK